eukprot:GHVS01075343.1.p1 GENE.GHVS01075343.1~~GHVS01075343.1.p1  ORF type:complete len:259 (-),score=38.42 GHVS01075343.1:322-1098(-)
MQDARANACLPIESQDALMGLYRWIDQMELSRPKRNINRDFADGVLMAEVVNYTFPRLTHLHNYSAANSRKQKLYNWSTLNNKVLSRLGFRIHQDDIEDIIESKPGAVERVLYAFQRSIGDIKTHLKLEGRVGPKASQSSECTLTKREDDEGEDIAQLKRDVDTDILLEREETIHELQETNIILKEKIKHLEQLVKLKDAKIETLTKTLHLERDPPVSRLPPPPTLRKGQKLNKMPSPTSSSSSASSPYHSPSSTYLR